MSLVDLKFNFECDWLIELSDNKLSNNKLASKLVGKQEFFKPITIEEIVIFLINQGKERGRKLVVDKHK